MTLWYEAVDQLLAGRTLVAPCRHQRSQEPLSLVGDAEGGWSLRGLAGSEIVAHFASLEAALLGFEGRVGSGGLRRAVAVHRYAHLFPAGSSLGWTSEPLGAWRHRPLPRWPVRERCAG